MYKTTGVKLLSTIIKLIGTLLFVILLVIFLIKINHAYIFWKVDNLVKEEFDKIQLSDELMNEKTISRYGCSYDYKVGALRCSVFYTKYFAVDVDPIKEFHRVDTYLTKLGWNYSFNKQTTDGERYRMLQLGYGPYEIYRKHSGYIIDMHMTFLGKKEVECKYYCSDKVKNLLNKYSNKNRSIYYITLSTDFIDR